MRFHVGDKVQRRIAGTQAASVAVGEVDWVESPTFATAESGFDWGKMGVRVNWGGGSFINYAANDLVLHTSTNVPAPKGKFSRGDRVCTASCGSRGTVLGYAEVDDRGYWDVSVQWDEGTILPICQDYLALLPEATHPTQETPKHKFKIGDKVEAPVSGRVGTVYGVERRLYKGQDIERLAVHVEYGDGEKASYKAGDLTLHAQAAEYKHEFKIGDRVQTHAGGPVGELSGMQVFGQENDDDHEVQVRYDYGAYAQCRKGDLLYVPTPQGAKGASDAIKTAAHTLLPRYEPMASAKSSIPPEQKPEGKPVSEEAKQEQNTTPKVKVGDRVRSKKDHTNEGVIVATRLFDSTRSYTVKWDRHSGHWYSNEDELEPVDALHVTSYGHGVTLPEDQKPSAEDTLHALAVRAYALLSWTAPGRKLGFEELGRALDEIYAMVDRFREKVRRLKAQPPARPTDAEIAAMADKAMLEAKGRHASQAIASLNIILEAVQAGHEAERRTRIELEAALSSKDEDLRKTCQQLSEVNRTHIHRDTFRVTRDERDAWQKHAEAVQAKLDKIREIL